MVITTSLLSAAASVASIVLASVTLTYSAVTRRRDRREKEESEKRDRDEAARRRLEDLIVRAAAAPTFAVLRSIEDAMAAEEPSSANFELRGLQRLVCGNRYLALWVESCRADIDQAQGTLTGLPPLGRDGASVLVAARMNAAGADWIANFRKALDETQRLARAADASAYAPHCPDTTVGVAK